MDISLYLAQLPGEPLRADSALLLCPFAPGFSLPDKLPGGILVFTDSTPYAGQSPEDSFPDPRLFEGLSFLLLDFQRRDDRLKGWIRALRQHLPCPVAAPPEYTGDGPVFLGALAPDEIPQAAAERWKGRRVILDLSPLPTRLTLTKSGCRRTAAAIPDGTYFDNDALLCSYRVTSLTPEEATFTLWRRKEQLLELARRLGSPICVALRQEWEAAPS